VFVLEIAAAITALVLDSEVSCYTTLSYCYCTDRPLHLYWSATAWWSPEC